MSKRKHPYVDDEADASGGESGGEASTSDPVSDTGPGEASDGYDAAAGHIAEEAGPATGPRGLSRGAPSSRRCIAGRRYALDT
jgi:hypothetical protein